MELAELAIVVGNWGNGDIWRITSGKFSSNAYFCEAEVAGGGVLIDAGLDGLRIDAELTTIGLRPGAVFCTHGHFDHIGSAAYFQKKYGCEVYLPAADEKVMRMSNFLLMALKLDCKIELPEVVLVEGRHVEHVGSTPLRYLPAPGHTPGSSIVEFGSAWFTGDTLYAREIGLSRLPGEDPVLLKKSILSYWSQLTSERAIFPGHGCSTDGLSLRTSNIALSKFLGLAPT